MPQQSDISLPPPPPLDDDDDHDDNNDEPLHSPSSSEGGDAGPQEDFADVFNMELPPEEPEPEKEEVSISSVLAVFFVFSPLHNSKVIDVLF